MRTFQFLATLFAMFIFTIVAGYKPSLIEKEYNRIKAPVENYFAEKQAKAMQSAKDKEWQTWSRQIHLPADCVYPRSAIREMECKNQWQLQADSFEQSWANRIASGWKP